jgi:hypothetical protein
MFSVARLYSVEFYLYNPQVHIYLAQTFVPEIMEITN